MTDTPIQEYDEDLQTMLELVWGEGFLSPGGPEEVARLLEGVDLAAKTVLDIGCGTGGIDFLLATKYAVARVTGIDVDAGLIARCKREARERGLDAVRFEQVRPGPLPFGDLSFDVAFSKDSMIHIEDKHAIFKEVFRVLKPGGMYVASDWLSGSDGPMSQAMENYVALEGLDFGMASAVRYREAMSAAGFVDVRLVDRNSWYRDVAKRELQAMTGPLYERGLELVGKGFFDHEIDVWRAMCVVLDSGELRPTWLRATRPT